MRPGLSQGDWAFQKEAWLLTGRPGLSQGDWASQMKDEPLKECLKSCPITSNTSKYLTFHIILKYKLCVNCKILAFATKQRKQLNCWPLKILLASERCSRVPALSDRLLSSKKCFNFFFTTCWLENLYSTNKSSTIKGQLLQFKVKFWLCTPNHY